MRHGVFFDNLVTHYDKRQFITKLLVHSIIHEIREQNESTYFKTIHKYIEQIIHNRSNSESITSPASRDSAKSINFLPSTMMSSVSTYLTFKDLTSFQHTSKHSYSFIVSTAASYSRMTLNSRMIQTYFDNFGDEFIHYKIGNLSRFRSIASLIIDIPLFIKLSQKHSPDQFWIWKKATKLAIIADENHYGSQSLVRITFMAKYGSLIKNMKIECLQWCYLHSDA